MEGVGEDDPSVGFFNLIVLVPGRWTTIPIDFALTKACRLKLTTGKVKESDGETIDGFVFNCVANE